VLRAETPRGTGLCGRLAAPGAFSAVAAAKGEQELWLEGARGLLWSSNSVCRGAGRRFGKVLCAVTAVEGSALKLLCYEADFNVELILVFLGRSKLPKATRGRSCVPAPLAAPGGNSCQGGFVLGRLRAARVSRERRFLR